DQHPAKDVGAAPPRAAIPDARPPLEMGLTGEPGFSDWRPGPVQQQCLGGNTEVDEPRRRPIVTPRKAGRTAPWESPRPWLMGHIPPASRRPPARRSWRARRDTYVAFPASGRR